MFGTIYALSNNFWLVALAHASTDYPPTGLGPVTGVPIRGLLFMGVLIAGAYLLGQHQKTGRRASTRM